MDGRRADKRGGGASSSQPAPRKEVGAAVSGEGLEKRRGGWGMEKRGSLEKVEKKGGGLEKVGSGYGEKRWGLVRV